MARGIPLVTEITTREHHTEVLLAQLAESPTDTGRAAITTAIVELNLGLSDALAHRYVNRGADRDDLVQVARMALFMAVGRFRPEAGRSFAAFAIPTITGELKRYFRDHCWVVRPPRRIQELRSRLTREGQRLEQSLGRPATTAELVAELDVDEDLVRESQVADGSFRPWSLDAPFFPGTDGSLASTLADDETAIDRLTDRLALQRALAGISKRDRTVLRWRFEEGCTQDEIGGRLGISQMQVSRIIRRILEHARHCLVPSEPLAG
jgi:RNA polymerase sigma-B factor